MSPYLPLNVTFDEMKPYLCLLSGLTIALSSGCVGSPSATAQTPVPVMAAPTATAASPLEELVAPIALYPDALIALILPAATASSDVVLAARYLNSSADPAGVDQQPWDDSVKGLAHYPEVIEWMDENLAWTQRLGEAYLQQPDQVMAAVQQARVVAKNKGLLTDTPQQQVVVQDQAIRIVPAQPDVIYVPRYDPEIIYVDRPVYGYSEPWISFGLGFGVGSWLAYDLDWGRRTIWVDHHRWDGPRTDWRHPHFPGRSDYVSRDHGWHQWRPAPERPRPPVRHFDRPGGRDFARPSPLPGAPGWNRDRHHDSDHQRDADSRGERANWSNRNVDRTRTPLQPNRVAAPQVRPDAMVPSSPLSNQDQSPRVENSPSAQRRRQTPNDNNQPGSFTERRSRPDRRPGITSAPSTSTAASAPGVINNVPARQPQVVDNPAPAVRSRIERQPGEPRGFRSPARVAAPAAQPAAVVQQPSAVTSPSQDPAPVVRDSPRADRSDRGGRSDDNRQSGRGRREQER